MESCQPEALAGQLRALGVEPGGVLLVHTSMRAVGAVRGGAAGLAAALRQALGPGGTLVVPAWTGDDDTPFDPRVSPVSPELGVLPDVFWRMDGVLRAEHPFALAAAGPRAAEILRDPLPIPPQVPASPVGRVHELDGQVLLLGVDHGSNTTIHLAELMAGVPYGVPKHCTVLRDGRPHRIDYLENDHCCQRFVLVDGWLRERGMQREGPVGGAHARLVRSRDVVAVVVDRLHEDPLFFLHEPGAACVECDLARASVPRPGTRGE